MLIRSSIAILIYLVTGLCAGNLHAVGKDCKYHLTGDEQDLDISDCINPVRDIANNALLESQVAITNAGKASLLARDAQITANDAKKIANTANLIAQDTKKITDEIVSNTVEQSEILKKSLHYHTNAKFIDAENKLEKSARRIQSNTINLIDNYCNKKIKEIGIKINSKAEHAKQKTNAGISSTIAISSIPYVAENSFSYGVGIGNYQNTNAIAAGIQYKTSPNTNIRLNFALNSSHDIELGAGFAGGW